MTPKEKADHLYNAMSHYTDGYMGSSMLSNFEYEDIKISRTVEAAMVIVNEVIEQWEVVDAYLSNGNGELNLNLNYWLEVKKQLNDKTNNITKNNSL